MSNDAQPLPTQLYTAAQVRELDRIAIEERGIPGIQLMKRAGRAVFAALLSRWSISRAEEAEADSTLTVYCGAGNNAGDGYIIAGLAAQRCLAVELVQVGDADKLSGDARLAYQFAQQEAVPMRAYREGDTPAPGVLVDALLGTGLSGDVRGDYVGAIAQINNHRVNNPASAVVAVDIPSGLCSDTGRVLGVAVQAQLTVSFIGLKRGLLSGRGPALCGELLFDDLRVPADIYGQVPAEVQRLDLSRLLALLPARAADAHKGDFGHVMVIGGDHGYGGAAMMAAEAAARTGAGLVSVATRPEHIPSILARRPELMAAGVNSGQELAALLSRPTVLVVGPGLGCSPWSEQLLQQALQSGLPMVVDADGLNILAEGRLLPAEGPSSPWIITPHPGEAARLLATDTASVQADRFAAARGLQQKFGAVAILKGAGSLVAAEDSLGVCPDGNPGMASGGMGDVLSGILGGLLAQGLSAEGAAALGVCLHGAAADLLAQDEGQRGMLATDLIPYVRELINGLGCDNG